MKIIFLGTPSYVIPILEVLRQSYNRTDQKKLIAVVTQKPKPAGRSRKLAYSAVDHWAFKRKIKVITNLGDMPDADLGILAAYGEIIPRDVMCKLKYGILNIHPSLLPKYRGASPIQAAILAGDTETGVSVIQMDEELDHGPIISTFKESIDKSDTTDTLRTRLFERSARFLIDLIPNYLNKKIKPKEQDHSKASFTRQLTKDDGFIPSEHLEAAFKGQNLEVSWKIGFVKNLSLSPTSETMDRFIRAMYPWPIAWTLLRLRSSEQATKRLKIIKSHVEEGRLVLDEVQLEGKKPVAWEEFGRGYPELSLGGK